MSIQRRRLQAPSYFVLASLLDGPRHGYAVLGQVEALSEGRVRLATGTLYAVLDRLHGAELIEIVSEEIVNGRTRRSYALTPTGRETLRAEAARLAADAAVVTDRMHRSATRLPGVTFA